MTTLTLSPVAVKPQFVVAVTPTRHDDSAAELQDQAHAWGKEDATEHIDMRGSVYFQGCALASYNEGYAAGLAVRKQLEGPSDELTFMAGVLTSLRAGATKPIVRLTAAQMFEIENERIGGSICESPYNW